MPIARTLHHDFFKTWSHEMAYVLGYFAADGSMLENNRGAHYIEFTSTDRVLLEHVQKATGSNHKINERISDSRYNPNWKRSYRIQIGSKQWFEDLENLGFTQNKSFSMKFPQVPDEFFADFVRGYFDGDGCAYFKLHNAKYRNSQIWVFCTRFTSGSLEFLMELWDTLKVSGIAGGHLNIKTKNAIRGGYDLVFSRHDSLALYRLMYHTSEVKDLFLPRKRELLEKAIDILNLDK